MLGAASRVRIRIVVIRIVELEPGRSCYTQPVISIFEIPSHHGTDIRNAFQ